MKKLNLLFVMLGLVSLTFFASCGEETEDVSPILTITPSSALELEEGELFTVEVVAAENVETKKRLENLTISGPDGLNFDTTIQASSFSATFEFVTPPARTAAYTFTFTATDRDGETSTRTLSVTSIEPTADTTPLGTPTSFEWNRCGGAPGTGLTQFGLQWTSNSATSAIITTSTQVKLVILSSSDWTAIDTKEGLAAAVDAATGVTSYTGVSATAPSQTYNDVIATSVNGEYYILSVESSTAVSQACGTNITVNGNYKN